MPDVTDGRSFRAGVLAMGELAESTPLQMAAAYGAVFRGGLYIDPLNRSQTKAPERVLRSETASAMVAMLEGVVTSELGTGKRAGIEGLRVAGKTGTGDLRNDFYYASFVGSVLEVERPFVALIGLEVADEEVSGPGTAAPAFARVARRILGR
jgi:cell division protein FtsI (penicillin-binding protein 3)